MDCRNQEDWYRDCGISKTGTGKVVDCFIAEVSGPKWTVSFQKDCCGLLWTVGCQKDWYWGSSGL